VTTATKSRARSNHYSLLYKRRQPRLRGESYGDVIIRGARGEEERTTRSNSVELHAQCLTEVVQIFGGVGSLD
jgi:hypothetical protein